MTLSDARPSASQNRGSRQEPRRLRVFDLFAGAGGLSEGFRLAGGYHVAAAVELDGSAAMTYAANHPETRLVQKDIREIGGDELRRLAGGKVDLLIAGPPCQGFSISGPRAQSHPSRELLYEVGRVIGELKPRAFLIENVPGMLSYQGGLVVDSFFRRLSRIDAGGARYSVVLETLDSAEFGVPQHRRRVFICGTLDAPFVFPAPLGRRVTLLDAIGDLPEVTAEGADHVLRLPTGIPLTGYVRARRRGARLLYNHSAKRLEERRLQRLAHIKEGEDKRALPLHLQVGGRDGKYRKLRGSRPSPTILAHMAHDTSSFIHPRYGRMLTVREAARLQSFNDTYRFLGSQTQQFRQVGNSVPPLVARALAEALEPFVRRRRRHPGSRSTATDRGRHGLHAAVDLALDLEVPESEDQPALGREPLVRETVSLLSAGDLGVPVRPGPARREKVRVAVPVSAVTEDGNARRAAERKVRLPRKRPRMASPAA